MNCTRSKKLILEQVAGTISAADQLILDKHLRSCGDCRAEKDKVGMLLDGIASQKEHEPGDDYWHSFNDRVFSRILEHPHAARWTEFIPIKRRFALVAAIAVLCIISFPFLYMIFMKKSPPPVRYEEQLQSVLGTAGYENASDLIDRVVPFYPEDNLLSGTIDLFPGSSGNMSHCESVSTDEFLPFAMIDELNDSEQEALRSQIESEMI